MTDKKTIKISYEQFYQDVDSLADTIKSAEKSYESYDSIFAIPRGGVPVAILLGAKLGLPVVTQ